MSRLQVQLHYREALREERIFEVHSSIRLGSGPGAALSFPGASLEVRRVGSSICVGYHSLMQGQELTLQIQPELCLQLRHLPAPWSLPRREPVFLPLLIATLAIGASGLWVERMAWSSWPERESLLVLPDLARTQASSSPWSVEAMPEARDLGAWDDHAWLDTQRSYLVESHPPPDELHRRLWLGEWSVVRGILEHSLQKNPLQPERWDQLAQCYRRLALYDLELEALSRGLELDPESTELLGYLAVNLARRNRWSEAEKNLRALQPQGERAQHFQLLVSALAGERHASLQALSQSLGSLSKESPRVRLMVMEDLALDPALSELRWSDDYRNKLSLHFGAAAPRKRYEAQSLGL